MGQHFVFRIQNTEYEGMRMPSGLYSAIVATIDMHKQKEFPYLLSDNTFKRRTIRANHVGDFRNELSEAGQIVLANQLVNCDYSDNKEVLALERTFTSPQLAVRIATAIELCDDAISRKKGLNIRIEDGSPDH